jgi:protein TonB
MSQEDRTERATSRENDSEMFRLLASKPTRARGGTAAMLTSAAVHAGLAAGLVWATLAAGSETEEDDEEVTVIEIAEEFVPPPPPPPPPEAPPPPQVDIPKGFQTLTTPVVITPDIPPPGEEISEEDFTGEGVEGGRATGTELVGPPGEGDNVSGTFAFTPYTVKPKCKSACSPEDILRHVPPLLKRSGVSCNLTVGIRIDTQGNVTATDMLKSSGNPGCDSAADAWARTTKWTTAYNRDQAVTVWIAQPVSITTQ